MILTFWVAMGIESLCTRHMAHSRCFVTVRRADDVCIGSAGQCAGICPWGHHGGRCWAGVVCGQDAHSGALCPWPCGWGSRLEGAQPLSSPGPRGASSVEIPKAIKWVHLILNVNLSRRLISWR